MFLCDQAEIDAITKVLISKKLFRYQGPGVETECSRFEQEFSNYLNIPHSLLLSSGTNALVTALFINGIGPGDEVLVPSYTFFATISSVLEIGAVPVIVNINENLTMDLEEAASKISSKTKAMIAVHIDGEPCDMDSIGSFVKKYNLILIEDVAQAIGGSFNGIKLGTFGEAGAFSFNMDKIITCGEGGAVVLKDQEKYQKALMFHDSCNQFGPTCKQIYTIEAFSGKSMRASEIQGTMLRVQLGRMESILARLKIRRECLKQIFQGLGHEVIESIDEKGSCATVLRIRLKDPSRIKDFIVSLNAVGLKSMSPIMRPGHNVWNWIPVLKTYGIYSRAQFLQTVDQLSMVALIFISLDENETDWALKINNLLEFHQRK